MDSNVAHCQCDFEFFSKLLEALLAVQIVATGFLRNSMINEEGAIVPEQFRMVEMFDRVDCLGRAVLGLTTQCAQCHSHKFDPLTQEEYYGLFAFLNNSYEAQSWVYLPEQQRQISEIHGRIRDAEQRLRRERPGWEQEMGAWGEQLLKGQARHRGSMSGNAKTGRIRRMMAVGSGSVSSSRSASGGSWPSER